MKKCVSEKIRNHPLNKWMKLVLKNPDNLEYRRRLDEEILAFAAQSAQREEDCDDKSLGSVIDKSSGAVDNLICAMATADDQVDISSNDMREMYLKMEIMRKIMKETRRIREERKNTDA